MFCTNCGASNIDDAKYCANCGESVMEAESGGIRLPLWILKVFSFFKKFNVLKTLLNFSFNQLITSRLIKFLYGLSILFAGLTASLLIYIGFHALMGFWMVALVVGTLILFLLAVIYSRVFLEMVITVSRLTGQPANSAERTESRDSIEWNIE
jgi:hypothetical protein